MSELRVEEFVFKNLDDAKLAESEKKKIYYLNTQLDDLDLENLMKLYERLNKEKIFVTPVGISYLQKIRKILLDHGVEESRIPAIWLHTRYSSAPKNIENRSKKSMLVSKKKIRLSLTLNILLILAVISMFIITLNSKNPNILNYEKVIQNKYSAWEQELTEREEKIRESERQLNFE